MDPPLATCDKTDGITLNVATTDTATYDDYRPTLTIKYRVVFESTYSLQTSKTVTDEFEVTYQDGCYNLALALTTGLSDYTYYVESTAA